MVNSSGVNVVVNAESGYNFKNGFSNRNEERPLLKCHSEVSFAAYLLFGEEADPAVEDERWILRVHDLPHLDGDITR